MIRIESDYHFHVIEPSPLPSRPPPLAPLIREVRSLPSGLVIEAHISWDLRPGDRLAVARHHPAWIVGRRIHRLPWKANTRVDLAGRSQPLYEALEQVELDFAEACWSTAQTFIDSLPLLRPQLATCTDSDADWIWCTTSDPVPGPRHRRVWPLRPERAFKRVRGPVVTYESSSDRSHLPVRGSTHSFPPLAAK